MAPTTTFRSMSDSSESQDGINSALRGPVPSNTHDNQVELAKICNLGTPSALKTFMLSDLFLPEFNDLWPHISRRVLVHKVQGPKTHEIIARIDMAHQLVKRATSDRAKAMRAGILQVVKLHLHLRIWMLHCLVYPHHPRLLPQQIVSLF
ncbi:hypothetical protein PVAG01_11491 [Phlyctema vagabunda]|uniref:Uncharacterized protein n=1 Tax=Phlyctema vagabunda TaxID=108571 RepID=A0ABR4P1A1_9HELO